MTMNPLTITPDDIIRIISGDVKHMPALAHQRLSDVAHVAEEIPLPQRTLTAHAVRQVLLALGERKIAPEETQAWASFVRRGYIPTTEKVVRIIDIPYEENREDAIVEAIGRMDELGDIIDGAMDDNEIRKLIDQLGD